MAKRFIDTKMWDKIWFRKLNPDEKLIWVYILTKCDHAGIFDADWEAMQFFIKTDIDDYKRLPESIKEKIVQIEENQFFIPSFIKYQYGVLRENSKPHISVIKRLREKDLLKALPKALITLKEQEQEQVKDKLEVRYNKFKNDVKDSVIDKKIPISEPEVQKFVNYWSELNKSETKMKFELQQTFEISRRLQTWYNRSNDFKKGVKNEREKMQFRAS